MRASVRPSVRGGFGDFWAFVPKVVVDLALSEGFNFGLREARLGTVRPDPSSGGRFAPVSIDSGTHLASPGALPRWGLGPGTRGLDPSVESHA